MQDKKKVGRPRKKPESKAKRHNFALYDHESDNLDRLAAELETTRSRAVAEAVQVLLLARLTKAPPRTKHDTKNPA